MRVAVDGSGIAPGTSGGIEQFTYRLIDGLAAAGPSDRFDLLIPARTRELWEARVTRAPNLRIHELMTPASLRAAAERRRSGTSLGSRIPSFVRRSRLARRAAYAWKQRQRAAAIARLVPDAVYLPSHLGGCPDAPTVVTVHDLRIHEAEYEDPIYAAALSDCLQRAQAVVTSWNHPRARLLELHPWLEPKLFTIPFPTMLSVSDGPSARRDRPYLLYPAATAPHKNHVRLLRAFAQVRISHDVRLVFTGPLMEPGAATIRRTTHDLDLDGRVELLGYVGEDELRALYRGCAAVVVPSLWEAASGPIMEALAFSRPICCSDIEPIRQQVEATGARVAFFDALDESDMARAIAAVLDDPHRFTGTTDVGTGRSPDLTWAGVGSMYLSIMRWVAAGADPAARPR